MEDVECEMVGFCQSRYIIGHAGGATPVGDVSVVYCIAVQDERGGCAVVFGIDQRRGGERGIEACL
jgi:hypothetical protein